jgi:hypothetical protein
MEEYLKKTNGLAILAKESIDKYSEDISKYAGYLTNDENERLNSYGLNYTWLEWAKFLILVCPGDDALDNVKRIIDDIVEVKKEAMSTQAGGCAQVGGCPQADGCAQVASCDKL